MGMHAAEYIFLIACASVINIAAAIVPPDLMVTASSKASNTNGLSRLLTQRAVQQILFYRNVQNDEITARWLGEFLQTDPQSRLSPDFHGVDALPSPSSAAYVCALLSLPTTLISVRRPSRRPPGGSRNNPYTKGLAFDDVAVEVSGPSLAEAIMEMRSTVAREWSQDLELFVAEDRAHRHRHATGMRAGVAGSEANDDATSLDRANSIPAFEAGRLGSADGRRGSPFRLASYDLLKLLATRTAVDRVSAEDGVLSSDESGRRWLSRFWGGRRDGFRGHSAWTQGEGGGTGAADSLVGALFDAEPSIVRTGSGGVDLVDPGGLAETVLAARADIAEEWAEALESVEDEHRCWRRWKSDLIK